MKVMFINLWSNIAVLSSRDNFIRDPTTRTFLNIQTRELQEVLHRLGKGYIHIDKELNNIENTLRKRTTMNYAPSWNGFINELFSAVHYTRRDKWPNFQGKPDL
jgi:hypothetical protein